MSSGETIESGGIEMPVCCVKSFALWRKIRMISCEELSTCIGLMPIDRQLLPAHFLQDPQALQVLIFGDPHPENWGVMVHDGEASLEMMDLDAAEHGPWHFDLRRLVLGLSVLSDGLQNCTCARDLLTFCRFWICRRST